MINKTTVEKIREDLQGIAKDEEYDFFSSGCIIEAEIFSNHSVEVLLLG